MLALFATLYQVELAGKRLDAHAARAAGAARVSHVRAPPSEWQYVAAAYLVVFVAVLAWVAIIGAKLQRLQREVGDLVELARERSADG